MSFTGRPELTEQEDITNDGFWPDLAMSDFMSDYHVPGEYDGTVIKQALISAIVRVNEKLKAAKLAVTALFEGSFEAFLRDNPNYEVNGTDWALLEYRNAVYARTKAMLMEQFNTLDKRKDRQNDVKDMLITEDYWLNQSQQSIYSLLAKYAPDSALTANHDTFIALI